VGGSMQIWPEIKSMNGADPSGLPTFIAWL